MSKPFYKVSDSNAGTLLPTNKHWLNEYNFLQCFLGAGGSSTVLCLWEQGVPLAWVHTASFCTFHPRNSFGHNLSHHLTPDIWDNTQRVPALVLWTDWWCRQSPCQLFQTVLSPCTSLQITSEELRDSSHADPQTSTGHIAAVLPAAPTHKCLC